MASQLLRVTEDRTKSKARQKMSNISRLKWTEVVHNYMCNERAWKYC